MTLVAAIGAMRSGALSCAALTQSLLERIDVTDANVQEIGRASCRERV